MFRAGGRGHCAVGGAQHRLQIEGDPTRSRVYKDIGAGIASGGIEYYLPLFFDTPGTIFDYLGGGTAGPPQACALPSGDGAREAGAKGPQPAALVLHGKVDEALERFWVDTRERHRFLQHDPERPLLPPAAIFMPAEEFFGRTQAHATLSLRGAEPLPWARPLPDLSLERGGTDPMGPLERHIAATPHRVLLLAESDGRRESLLELLRDHRINVPSVDTLEEFITGPEKVAIAAAPLAEGFHWLDADEGLSIQFVTETELFATTPQRRRGAASGPPVRVSFGAWQEYRARSRPGRWRPVRALCVSPDGVNIS